MNILKISIKNFVYKPLYTFLGIFILSFSIALLLGIQKLDTSLKQQFDNNLGGIDMVVGAKGSPLQLVLASVLHIDNPTGNISFEEAKSLSKNPMIEMAVPISYGDNYKGYRIVGTTDEFAHFYDAELQEGKSIQKSMEVVLGATVAEILGLKIGDTFQSSHGLAQEGHQHANILTVAGIYKPTHKTIDRLIITPLETIWDFHEHPHENHSESDDDEKHDEDYGSIENHEEGNSHHKRHHDEDENHQEITSMLVSFRNPMALLTLPRKINETTNMQAVLPKYELERLYQFTGVGVKTITVIAYAILFISCITIFISLYRMVRDRAFDLALMRSYGASNYQLIKMIVYEGGLIAVMALALGALLSQLGTSLIFRMISDQYKQQIPMTFDYPALFKTAILVALTVWFAVAFAIYPIVKMNISKILSDEK